MIKFKYSRGFTLMQTLMAIGIAIVLLAVVLISFSKLNSNKALEKSAELVASVLDEARALTLSNKNSYQYGVKLEALQVTLFRGAVYSALDPNNTLTLLHSLVGIRNISLSGGATSVVFKRLTGETDQNGTLEVYLKSDPLQFYTITISNSGIIEID